MTPDRLRHQVLAAAAATPSPTRAEAQRSVRLAFAGAGAVTLGLFILAGGARTTGRPLALVVTTACVAAFMAVLAWVLAVRRAPSPRGRSQAFLIAVLTAVPLAMVGGKLALSFAWPGMTEWWPERPGLRCLCMMLLLGAAPLAASWWAWRHRAVRHPALSGAALGIASGACAWLLVDLWCPVAHPHHLALGHLLPLGLLAVAGMVALLIGSPSPRR